MHHLDMSGQVIFFFEEFTTAFVFAGEGRGLWRGGVDVLDVGGQLTF